MNHIILGYTDQAARSTPVLLYAGPSRSDAKAAMEKGGEGIVRADYHCDPMPQQTRRFGPKSPASDSAPASVPDAPPPPADGGSSGTETEAATPPPAAAKTPLPLPGKPSGKDK